jgi:hypothetical protein
VASFATRADKDPTLGAEELRPQWKDRARSVGLGPRRLDAVLDRTFRRPGPVPGPGMDCEAPPAAVAQALADLGRGVTRRDVVRAWCRSLPAGAPAPVVEDGVDRLLDGLAPESGARGHREGPGVAERRHAVPGKELDRDVAAESAEVWRLLARRGIGLDRSARRPPDVGLGFG